MRLRPTRTISSAASTTRSRNTTNLFVRYTGDLASVFEPNSGSPIPLWNSDDETGNHYVTAELRQVVKPTMANTVRVGCNANPGDSTRTDLDNGLLVFFPGRMSGIVNPGSGVVRRRWQSGAAVRQRQTRIIVGDDVVWSGGGHSFKFGAEYERQTTFVDLPLFGDGAWTFPSLTAFLQNQPSIFLGALPGATDAARNIDEWRITSYVQDEWRLGRYDAESRAAVRPARDSDARQGAGTGGPGAVDRVHDRSPRRSPGTRR